MSERNVDSPAARVDRGHARRVPSRPEFTRRAAIVVGLVALAVAVGLALARAADVFFLVFLAAVAAALLRGLADGLGRWTGMSPGWSLAAVVLAVAALAVVAVVGMGAAVVAQVGQLSADLPRSLDQVRGYLQQREWGRQLLESMPSAGQVLSGGQATAAASQIAALFSTTLGVLGNLLVFTFLTLYLAADPKLYVNGVVRLVPPRRRGRARAVLGAVGYHLKWWGYGRLVAMAAVGVMTSVGLGLLGVPQYLVLGLIAAGLVVIPFFGPLLAAVPAVLIAFMQGPMTALWVALLYAAVQAVENYLITPLVQQQTVNLPPAVAIGAIVLAGMLFGGVALLAAAPLAVAVMVAVKMLYVEDTLGDRVDVPGEPAAA